MYYRRGMGAGPTSTVVSHTLLTAAGSDPDPTGISQAILAIGGLITSLFSFGYNPQKLNDTAVTEQVQMLLHQLWYTLSGEDLGGGGGGGCTCTPGKCGSQHCAIFTTSAYPNVPFGPSGNPAIDVNNTIAQAQNIISQGQQALQRSESLSDYQANTNYMLSLFQQVLQARQSPPTDPSSAAGAGDIAAELTSAIGSNWFPYAAAAVLALVAVM